MKRFIPFFAFLGLALAVLIAEASPNLPTVTPERLMKLKEMHLKAERQVASENYQAAMRTYQDIVLMEPDDETAYANMGQLYLMFSDFKKAERAFENALSIDPDNETALGGLKKIKDPDGVSYP